MGFTNEQLEYSTDLEPTLRVGEDVSQLTGAGGVVCVVSRGGYARQALTAVTAGP